MFSLQYAPATFESEAENSFTEFRRFLIPFLWPAEQKNYRFNGLINLINVHNLYLHSENEIISRRYKVMTKYVSYMCW